MRHHHRMAGGRALGGIEAQRGQVRHQPVGGAGAIGLEGRVGRDRGDAQQIQQPVGRLRQISVDAGEDGIEGHRGAPFVVRGDPIKWWGSVQRSWLDGTDGACAVREHRRCRDGAGTGGRAVALNQCRAGAASVCGIRGAMTGITASKAILAARPVMVRSGSRTAIWPGGRQIAQCRAWNLIHIKVARLGLF